MTFAGRVVMVTGAGSGLGAQTARAFMAAGAQVAICDVDGDALASVAAEGAALAEVVDITDSAAVARHVARIEDEVGPLEIAVNNAGIAHDLAALEDISDEDFDRVVAVNLRGAFACLKAQLPPMKARKSGAITLVASAAGLAGAARLSAYAASKHGVVGLMRSAAEEGARYGVRVNAVCPSFAKTRMLDDIAAPLVDRFGVDDAMARISNRVPMARAAEIDEIVQAILWTVSPDNSFMTGAAIPIDGGLTAI